MITAFANADACWKELLADVQGKRALLQDVAHFARTNPAPCTVVFGTSGWRGITGSDFTFNNVRVVTAAIVQLLRLEEPAVLQALGVASFAEAQQRGLVVGHDNRFLGPEFARAAIAILRGAGIRTYYAGEAITPELSAAVIELKAAGSINLTPSHNPASYSGYKFNPADGGPAGPELTTVIERLANGLMATGASFRDLAAEADANVDPTDLWLRFTQHRGSLDLDRIRQFVATADVLVVTDHVHGATRGRPERLLGASPKVQCLRTNDDYLFGGIAPEPSSANMKLVNAALAASHAKHRLGVIMDPDGDRVRFSDGERELEMNYFGALALHYLYTRRKVRGVLVKSVATSNFANAIAKGLGIEIRETPVGFKNFRPYMLPNANPRAIVTFEESDGISGYLHTLEKDALYGLMLALEMMATTGQSLSTYLREVQAEFGAFYPSRAGITVDRALAGRPLTEKLSRLAQAYRVGDRLTIGAAGKTIADVITLDGTKIVFDDGSWLLIRPSGTEPKVRFYVETRSAAESQAMFTKAEELTRSALAGKA